MDGGLIGDVSVLGGLGQVGVVSRQAGRKSRLWDIRAPDGKQAIALGIGVLKNGKKFKHVT